MTHKRRITALECVYQKRHTPPTLEAARHFFANLHKAWGPPNTPVPPLTDTELKAMPALIKATIEAVYGQAE